MAKTSLKSLPLKPIKEVGGRYFFTEERSFFDVPDLLEIQKNSYEWFLGEGLKELLESVSPIVDFSEEKAELVFLEHSVEAPKYDEFQSKKKNISFEAPIKTKVQLINKETGEIKEQEIFLGNIPLMTPRGTFIINGVERVVVNQVIRSEGVYFAPNPGAPGMGMAKLIPNRGAWLEIETDKKGIIYVKIDRRRKIPLTTLIRALGFSSDKDIMNLFSDFEAPSLEQDFIRLTLEKDQTKDSDEACQFVHKKIRPGDLATPENAKALIDSIFFDPKKYDIGAVARYKINERFGTEFGYKREERVFNVEEFILIIKHLLQVNIGEAEFDDIDHLANRRVRSVGEQVKERFRIGLIRVERIARDRMTTADQESFTPLQLINSRPITAVLREFFSSSQLSQFMDQTNFLAEISHKRRISAVGPGGLTRERASMEVRDIHMSHYGRLCPIETPEGPNIGLITHMATYAKVNNYGFIETPYMKIAQFAPNDVKHLVNRILAEDIKDPKTKKLIANKHDVVDEALAKKIVKALPSDNEIEVRSYITNEVEYYSAGLEEKMIIAQANTPIDEHGNLTERNVSVRMGGEPQMIHYQEVTHMDISPKQILGISAALIPFMEHDENTRALMGSNMQRQAVPLLRSEAPIVGTGMERLAGIQSGYCVVAEDEGEVTYVDGKMVSVVYKNGKKQDYSLINYIKTNNSSMVHQIPRVVGGQKVKKGDILVDGQALENGEAAVGKNVLVAYVPWRGYNFEDAVIISNRLVEDDVFTSVHIEEFTVDVRDTKLGPEITTRDIPNVSESKLKDLDEDGIVRVGASVSEGDILVGKITPKGQTELTAEERLLQAIFGEKAKDVKDTSKKMPSGASGKVIDIHILTRQNGDELQTGVIKQIRIYIAETRKMEVGDKMAGRHGNKGVVAKIVPQEDMPFLEDGTPVDIILNPLGVPSRMNVGQVFEAHLGLAAKAFGINVATPALNGIPTKMIEDMLEASGFSRDGKVQLFDGRTGEPFIEKSLVGYPYMLKLHHLVADKMHARSVGPYSLVTQQPLGGKSQGGGQRFGEMEVWALEAYGAAYTLQEMLTIKSDDVRGRAKAFEKIVKQEPIDPPNIPESFNLLLNELRALGLSINLISDEGELVGENEVIEKDDEEVVLSDNKELDAMAQEMGVDLNDMKTIDLSGGVEVDESVEEMKEEELEELDEFDEIEDSYGDDDEKE